MESQTKEIWNGFSNKRDFKRYLKQKRYFKYKLKKISQTKEIKINLVKDYEVCFVVVEELLNVVKTIHFEREI